MVDGPSIPTEIRRRVLVEAGHRCAIPTCRHIDADVYPFVPWVPGQPHKYDNLIALCPACQRRAEKGEIDPESLRLSKVNMRFIHDKYSQLEVDLLFMAADLPDGMFQWPSFMRLLLNRSLESELFEEVILTDFVFTAQTAGTNMVPIYLMITEKGRQLIEELGLSEL